MESYARYKLRDFYLKIVQMKDNNCNEVTQILFSKLPGVGKFPCTVHTYVRIYSKVD